jgi:hypothetical protein
MSAHELSAYVAAHTAEAQAAFRDGLRALHAAVVLVGEGSAEELLDGGADGAAAGANV